MNYILAFIGIISAFISFVPDKYINTNCAMVFRGQVVVCVSVLVAMRGVEFAMVGIVVGLLLLVYGWQRCKTCRR